MALQTRQRELASKSGAAAGAGGVPTAPPSIVGGSTPSFLGGSIASGKGKTKTVAAGAANTNGLNRAAGGGSAAGVGPKMRQFHWDVMVNTAGTIWESDHMADDDSEMDVAALFPDLEDALAVAAPKPASKTTGAAEKVKPKQVTMVEPKRSQNICIMLAQFGRKPFSDIVKAVNELDVDAIGLSGVTALLDFVPEESERAMIDEFIANGGQMDLLGKAEKYIISVSEVPMLKQRLLAMNVKCTFGDDLTHLEEDIELVIAATAEVQGSTRFPKLLKLVLQLGNALNEGSAKGGAQGFKISNLMKLAQTKTNQGTTLLAYLVSSMEKSNPDMLQLEHEFPSTKESARKSGTQMTTDFKKLERGVTLVENVIKTGIGQGDNRCRFQPCLNISDTLLTRHKLPLVPSSFKKLEAFRDDSKAKLTRLTERYEQVRSARTVRPAG